MKLKKIEDYTTSQFILVIALIILLIPPLLSLPSIFEIFNFSNKGQIGDTIGGITAPFINGLAAILVFLAFKAQIEANKILVNANKILQQQENARTILEQIKIIQDDKIKIEEILGAFNARIGHLPEPEIPGFINLINKTTFFTGEIRLAYNLIIEYEGEKDFLWKKLFYLYVIVYKDIFDRLRIEIQATVIHHDYEFHITELLLSINFLNENIVNVNRFR